MDVLNIFTATLLTFYITEQGAVHKIGEVHYQTARECEKVLVQKRLSNKKKDIEFVCEWDGVNENQ